MALILARTLTLAPPAASPSSLRTLRALSAKVELIEIDLSEDSPSSSGVTGDSTVEAMGMRRLEDAIHGVLVRRSAPEWLPFVPGGSYWVPPMRRPLGVSDLVGTVVYTARGAAGAAVMTEEEAMCFTTTRGWPSAAYFVEGEVDKTCLELRSSVARLRLGFFGGLRNDAVLWMRSFGYDLMGEPPRLLSRRSIGSSPEVMGGASTSSMQNKF